MVIEVVAAVTVEMAAGVAVEGVAAVAIEVVSSWSGGRGGSCSKGFEWRRHHASPHA